MIVVIASVKSPRDWPRMISRRFGESREVEMPDHFFDPEGNLPETATLGLVRPMVFCGLSDAEFQGRLAAAVASLVKRAREDFAARGIGFLGRRGAVRQSFSAAAKTPAPRRNPAPRMAAKFTPARVDAIRRMVGFVREYRAAREQWRKGERSAVFPAGTYALRIYGGVPCAVPS